MSRRTPPGNLLAELRGEFDGCLTDSCRQGGCRLGLKGMPRNRVIVDGDKYKERFHLLERLCDRILFWARTGVNVAVVELKSGPLDHVRDAEGQLQNGSKTAQDALLASSDVGFLAILLHGGRVEAIEVKVLRDLSISFRERRYPIMLGRCGEDISDIARRYDAPI